MAEKSDVSNSSAPKPCGPGIGPGIAPINSGYQGEKHTRVSYNRRSSHFCVELHLTSTKPIRIVVLRYFMGALRGACFFSNRKSNKEILAVGEKKIYFVSTKT